MQDITKEDLREGEQYKESQRFVAYVNRLVGENKLKLECVKFSEFSGLPVEGWAAFYGRTRKVGHKEFPVRYELKALRIKMCKPIMCENIKKVIIKHITPTHRDLDNRECAALSLFMREW